MKNIIAFVGSLRKDSINRHIYQHYKQLSATQFSFTEAVYSEFPFYNSDIAKEPTEVSLIADKIKKADAIIFFCPEYNYSIPGALKNALDWLSRSVPNPFNNKFATIIGASPGQLGTGRMQYHLRQVGVFLNLHFMNAPEVMINNAFDKVKDGKVVDEETSAFLQKHITSFAHFLS